MSVDIFSLVITIVTCAITLTFRKIFAKKSKANWQVLDRAAYDASMVAVTTLVFVHQLSFSFPSSPFTSGQMLALVIMIFFQIDYMIRNRAWKKRNTGAQPATEA